MSLIGRGAITQVQYTGDEAAPEIKKLLNEVVANEDDYALWEKLVAAATDLEGGVTRNSSPSAIELVRNVFDCFLAKFPLFFGFWKKYADLEFSIGGTETAEMVYERGVSCVSSSVDLWTHYCAFKMETCHVSDVIRELFERGAHCVGLDYQSHSFWDKYIEFEGRVPDGAVNIVKIHERIQHIPMYEFTRYYTKFITMIVDNNRSVEDLTDPETLEAVKMAVVADNQGYPEKSDVELDRQLRDKIHQHYYTLHAQITGEVHDRWTYESEIKRHYFHVTDPDEKELQNWRKYLDFEEAQGDFVRTAFLYERCLVVCALFEDFWLRYARWMYSQGKDEDARIIYMKASCIFVPIDNSTIRLHWARFEEKLGRIQIARDIHLGILQEIPNHVETIISLAGLERRHEGHEVAIQTLQQYILQHSAEVAGQLTAEQSRIYWECTGDADKARQVLRDGHEQYLDSRDFWLSYLKFEIAQPASNNTEAHARIKEVHEAMRTKARFSQDVIKELSYYYMEYLLARGGKDAANEYMVLDKEINGFPNKDKNKEKNGEDSKQNALQGSRISAPEPMDIDPAELPRTSESIPRYSQEQGESTKIKANTLIRHSQVS